jgi:hypothetical protein
MDQQQPVELRDLLASVGRVMLYWGFLESEFRDQLQQTGTDWGLSPYPAWRRAADRKAAAVTASMLIELDDLASARNLLAHGLTRADARTHPGEEAHVACLGSNGGTVSFSLRALDEIAERMDAIRRLMVRGFRLIDDERSSA